MDWPRARSYLIFGFLILNIFLGHRLWYERQLWYVPEPASSAASFQELLGELEAAGISLAVDLPPAPADMAGLEIMAADLILGPVLPLFIGREMDNIIDNGGQRLVPRHPLGMEIVVSTDHDGDRPPDGEARSIAEEYLAQAGGIPGDVHFDYVEQGPGGATRVHYTRHVEERPVFNTRLTVEVDGQGVLRVEHLLGGITQVRDEPQSVIDGMDALRVLAQEVRKRGDGFTPRVVTGIDIGYWGLADDGPWIADPAWRIRLGDGDIIFVDASDGQVMEFRTRDGH